MTVGTLIKIKPEHLPWLFNGEEIQNRLRHAIGVIVKQSIDGDGEPVYQIAISGTTYEWFEPRELEVICK